ncbi:MAG: synthetase, partial [Candidatus Eremiobacteraeota bacterium]|nr:synthetase [Candidatus Eremiobacteraeota bacterium]
MNVQARPATVVILDFGSQVSQLIARRAREANVYSELLPYDVSWDEIAKREPSAIVLSGGPESTFGADALECDPRVYESGLPLLGICYGMQLLVKNFGGELERLGHSEFGPAQLIVDRPDSPLLLGVPRESRVWMSHGDSVKRIPPGFTALGHTASSSVAAMSDDARRLYATLFHPEVVHTEAGTAILENFLHTVAGIPPAWRMDSWVDDAIEKVRAQVGDANVLCALSGGVDSAVAATLVARAIGKQLTCIYVDTGLMRKNESEGVVAAFRDVLHLNVIHVDAERRFLERLAGIEDPEEKRIRIGHEFIAIFEEESKKIDDVRFLVQGTLYPDVIESKTPGSKAGHKIKSHHNVGGLPERMALGLVEPLRALFKDEVREAGRVLGLPNAIVERQPFPGPGLAVRIIGDITREKLDTVREADWIVTSEIDAAIAEGKLSPR